ncbi:MULTISPECIES: hypothetical protein [unclassified Streptomyces]|nr:hypothetical protein OG324_47090 [Streptomyces sp. NBC_01236]
MADDADQLFARLAEDLQPRGAKLSKMAAADRGGARPAALNRSRYRSA